MTRILLIRHGANDAHKKGVLTGWTPGVHLNPEGRAQAKALAQRLASTLIEAVYASPLERTLETAEIIAAGEKAAMEALPRIQASLAAPVSDTPCLSFVVE